MMVCLVRRQQVPTTAAAAASHQQLEVLTTIFNQLVQHNLPHGAQETSQQQSILKTIQQQQQQQRQQGRKLTTRCCPSLLVSSSNNEKNEMMDNKMKNMMIRKSFSISSSSTFSSTSSSSSASSASPPFNDDDPKRIYNDNQYCINLVRERDHEGYLCGLLMPSSSMNSYFALRAFNVELASIKDISSSSASAGGQTFSSSSRMMRQSGGEGSNMPPIPAGDMDDEDENEMVVPETSLALQMRIQWWRNAIEQICKQEDENENDNDNNDEMSSSEHEEEGGIDMHRSLLRSLSTSCWNSPVVRSLYRAHMRHGFTRRFLERLIDSRELDLSVLQYRTINELIQYSDDTVCSLLYLTLETCNVRDDHVDNIAYHTGIGIGLTTAIRSTPYRLLKGEISIPSELFPTGFPYQHLIQWRMSTMLKAQQTANDQSQNETESELDLRLTQSEWEDFNNATNEMSNIAIHHLMKARDIQNKIPKQYRSSGVPQCLLPIVPTFHYLSKLRKAENDIFHSSLIATTPGHQHNAKDRLLLLLLLGRTWLTGVF